MKNDNSTINSTNSNASILSALFNKKVFIRTGTTDFREGIDTLAAKAASISDEDFFNGSLFVFCSKSRKQIRIIFWEGCGVWMITRKLSKSKFFWASKNSNNEDVLSCYNDLITLLKDPVSWSVVSAKKIAKKLSIA